MKYNKRWTNELISLLKLKPGNNRVSRQRFLEVLGVQQGPESLAVRLNHSALADRQVLINKKIMILE